MDTKSLKDGAEAVAAMVPGEEARKALGDTPDTVLYLSGASGTGKSSLVAAGLTPALTAKGWTVLPVRGMGAPLASLTDALHGADHPTPINRIAIRARGPCWSGQLPSASGWGRGRCW